MFSPRKFGRWVVMPLLTLFLGTAMAAEIETPPTTDLEAGELHAVMSAGRLPLITNETLRFKLTAWGGIFGDLLDDEIMGREFVLDKIIPYFMEHGVPLSQAWNLWEKWPIPPRSVTADPAAFQRLLADPGLQTILEGRYVFWAHTTGEYQAALAAINEILEEIGKSL